MLLRLKENIKSGRSILRLLELMDRFEQISSRFEIAWRCMCIAVRGSRGLDLVGLNNAVS